MKYSCLLPWLRFPLSGCLSSKPYCYSCRRIAGNHAEAAQGEILKDLHLISRSNQMWMLWSPSRSVTRQCCGIIIWPHVSFSDCSDPRVPFWLQSAFRPAHPGEGSFLLSCKQLRWRHLSLMTRYRCRCPAQDWMTVAQCPIVAQPVSWARWGVEGDGTIQAKLSASVIPS